MEGYPFKCYFGAELVEGYPFLKCYFGAELIEGYPFKCYFGAELVEGYPFSVILGQSLWRGIRFKVLFWGWGENCKVFRGVHTFSIPYHCQLSMGPFKEQSIHLHSE